MGPRSVDPHPARLAAPAAQSTARLDVFRRTRDHHGRASGRVRTRQGDRRLVVDQRHGLRTRASRRLRSLGRSRLAGLVVCERAAVLPAAGGLGRRRRCLSRRRRSADHRRVCVQRSVARGVLAGGRCGWPSPYRRLQRRDPGRLRRVADHDPSRPPVQHRRRVPATGVVPSQPDGENPGAGDADHDGRRSRGGRRIRRRGGRRSPDRPCRPRGDPRRRRDQFSPTVDVVGHRRSRPTSAALG